MFTDQFSASYRRSTPVPSCVLWRCKSQTRPVIGWWPAPSPAPWWWSALRTRQPGTPCRASQTLSPRSTSMCTPVEREYLYKHHRRILQVWVKLLSEVGVCFLQDSKVTFGLVGDTWIEVRGYMVKTINKIRFFFNILLLIKVLVNEIAKVLEAVLHVWRWYAKYPNLNTVKSPFTPHLLIIWTLSSKCLCIFVKNLSEAYMLLLNRLLAMLGNGQKSIIIPVK